MKQKRRDREKGRKGESCNIYPQGARICNGSINYQKQTIRKEENEKGKKQRLIIEGQRVKSDKRCA